MTVPMQQFSFGSLLSGLMSVSMTFHHKYIQGLGCLGKSCFSFIFFVIYHIGFEGRIWVLIALVPGHSLLFTFIYFKVKYMASIDQS